MTGSCRIGPRGGAPGVAARRRRAGTLLLTAAFLGCTAPPAYYLAAGHEGAPGIGRVLLCPPNVALSLPAEIAGGAKPLRRELVAHLERRGLEVQHLDLHEARFRWLEAGKAAKHDESDDAAGIFVRSLSRHHEFDVVMMPSLIVRTVRVTDSSGTWDGVRRSVRTVNAPNRGGVRGTDTFSKGIAFGGVTGDMLAASMHVIVLSRDGQRVFEGSGGIDFVQEADLSAASSYRASFPMAPRLIRNPRVLREGVEIAFGAYLPPVGEP